jgi:hypothetical protein
MVKEMMKGWWSGPALTQDMDQCFNKRTVRLLSDHNHSTEETMEEKKQRKPRKDKGVKKGPRKTKTQAKKDGRLVPASLDHYVKHEIKTPSGNKVLDVDDEAAKRLRGMDLEKVYDLVAEACGVSKSELKKKYAKLNLGMQRMNLGNKFRAVLTNK